MVFLFIFALALNIEKKMISILIITVCGIFLNRCFMGLSELVIDNELKNIKFFDL